MVKRIGLVISVAALLVGIIFLWAQTRDRQARHRGQRSNVATPASKTLPKTEAEKKILAVIDDIYQNQSPKTMLVLKKLKQNQPEYAPRYLSGGHD